MSEYPEHDKLREVAEQSQSCGEFLDWLTGTKGFAVCALRTENDAGEELLWPSYQPAAYRIGDLLAEFFGIDQDALEREKRQMLEQIRSAA